MRALGVTIATAALLAAPSAQAESTTVIRLISTFQHANVIDRAPKGEAGAGDVIVSVNRLANASQQFGRPKGAVVGHSRGRFTLLPRLRMGVDGWTTLPGGRLHVRGNVHQVDRRNVAMRVVGGAGAFAGARGTVSVTPYPDTARTLVVFSLRLG